MEQNQTIYVVDVDGMQALAATEGQAKQLILEKFQESIDAMFSKKPNENGTRAMYFRTDVTTHETGKTGWTKSRR